MGRYEDAKDELHRFLRNVARKGDVTTYGDAVKQMPSWPNLGPDDPVLAQMLDELSTEEDGAGRGMLSAVVRHATGDHLPGDGFFKLATKLGHDASDRLAFHAAELQRVWNANSIGV